jgi:hypothetical protein
MPYHHPTAVTIRILWWGIYFGCLGSSIGGLIGLWAGSNGEGAPAREEADAPAAGREPRLSRKSTPVVEGCEGIRADREFDTLTVIQLGRTAPDTHPENPEQSEG